MNAIGSRLTSTAPHSMRVRSRVPITRLFWSAYSFSTLRTSITSTLTNSKNTTAERLANTRISAVVEGFRNFRLLFSVASVAMITSKVLASTMLITLRPIIVTPIANPPQSP